MKAMDALSIIFKLRKDSEFFRGVLAGRNAIPHCAEEMPDIRLLRRRDGLKFGVSEDESIYLKRLINLLNELSSSISNLVNPDIRDT